MDNSNFYDTLSSDYDDMINFENSLKNKMVSLKNFISPIYKTALDLGCGTGTDSIALSKLGLTVDAVDHSKGMLEQALINSKRFETQINFTQSGLTEFTSENKSYDIIISLGNTIANINSTDLKSLSEKLYGYLNSNGIIVIQIINYANLPKSGAYILNEYDDESKSIIRKYEMHTNEIDFIIETLDKRTNQEKKIITKLYPHSENDFRQISKENGYNIELFGNLKKEEYFEEKSQNLVVVLTKKYEKTQKHNTSFSRSSSRINACSVN
jgi:glycine/sarcosine N-methyltransferase